MFTMSQTNRHKLNLYTNENKNENIIAFASSFPFSIYFSLWVRKKKVAAGGAHVLHGCGNNLGFWGFFMKNSEHWNDIDSNHASIILLLFCEME